MMRKTLLGLKGIHGRVGGKGWGAYVFSDPLTPELHAELCRGERKLEKEDQKTRDTGHSPVPKTHSQWSVSRLTSALKMGDKWQSHPSVSPSINWRRQ